ncbi:flagellar biosynthetic protein FliR [Ruminococcaceae bacterium OttesenSCG-928-L11]|nr:flagellar biosynthetic protein FliR [Ruminococcaceae bacterium OttesenSCG-928-L11]
MTIETSQALTFMLIMVRMVGMLVLNPIFGRANVPSMVNAGIAMVMSIMLIGVVPEAPVADPMIFPLLILMAKELLLGFVTGLLLRMFLAIIVVGGETIDMQMGISMSKAFDPGSNTSISVSASIMNVMFLLIFFGTNNHLTFFKLITNTFYILPVGGTWLNFDGFYYLPELLSVILIFAVKLALPVIVIEIITSMAVGIIMRIIPQINVFVVNIQFKLLIGIFLLYVLVAPMTGYFESLIELCFEYLHEAWMAFL